jgi:serine/threonine protein kinase
MAPGSDIEEQPTEPLPVSQFFAPGTVLGKYEIIRLIGHGGMGAVYEASHRALRSAVAIKTLHGRFASSPSVRARFEREGQAACRVEHDHAVKVLDLGIQGDVPYLVMELLRGESLAQLLEREQRLSPSRAADLLIPVLAALHAAHQSGLVHRDLKPDNVFLCRRPSGEIQPKLVDFGISKFVQDESAQPLTETSAVLGTPHYMSPEQAQTARDVDARSDQYSVGVMLYEVITGRRPFHGDTLYSLLSAIIRGDYPPPRSLVPEIPEHLEAIISRALNKDPAQRFPSVADLGLKLLRYASERTSILHKQEFAGESQPPAPNLVSDVQALGMAATEPSGASGSDHLRQPSSSPPHAVPSGPGSLSTLGGSVATHGTPPIISIKRRRTGAVAVAVVAASFVGLVVWRTFTPTASSDSHSDRAFLGAPSGVASRAPSLDAATYPDHTSSTESRVTPTPERLVKKRVDSLPQGASVTVNGRLVGPTPTEVEFPEGVLEVGIEVKAPGFAPVRRTVSRGDPADLSFKLKTTAAPVSPAKREPSRSTVPKLAPR